MNSGNFVAKLIIGMFFILLGLGLFFDQLGITFFGWNIFNLWPLLLVLFGLVQVSKRSYMSGLFLLLLGFAFLFSTFFHFSAFAVIWPLIIIFIGLSILFKPYKSSHWESSSSSSSGSVINRDRIDESIVFWALDEIVKSDNFVGGKIDAIFGGFKIDLRDVKVSKDGARLEVNGVFGGGELLLPKDVRIDVETSSVMGGVTNHATSSGKSEDPIFRIKASAVFGGLEIKN